MMLTRSVARGHRCVRQTTLRRSVFELAKVLTAWSGRVQVSEEVEHALEHQEPVVALESAIITHGMPHPTNLSTSSSLESILRSRSVTPATIALIDGTVHVGLSPAQLTRLADPQADLGRKVKVSRRDLAPALSAGFSGGTTVSATMYIAHSAGIELFVTGGIGGVHRGAEKTFDISADLLELGRTPVGVICAGAKSILDIPRTLEVLETNGVCVSTYGETKDFPAFYSPVSGSKSPWNVDAPASAAQLIHCGLTLPQPLSTLLAVPIPSEYADAGERVQKLVERVVAESLEQDIKGNEVTPWLLKRVGELSGGETLRLNIALIENNARVGAEIALELNKLKSNSDTDKGTASLAHHSGPHVPKLAGKMPATGQRRQYSSFPSSEPLPPPKVIVIGAAALDITSSASTTIAPGSTTPGRVQLTPGGVARNIAESAQRFLPPNSVQLISAIGTSNGQPDPAGVILLHEMKTAGLRTDGMQMIEGEPSATCSLVLDESRDLVAGVADMAIVEKVQTSWIRDKIASHKPEMVVFDCNSSVFTLAQIFDICSELNIPTFCDPTSTAKSIRLLQANALKPSYRITHIAPNRVEAEALLEHLVSKPKIMGPKMLDTFVDRYDPYAQDLDNFVRLASEECRRCDEVQQAQWLDAGTLSRMTILLNVFDSVWIKAGPEGMIHLQKTHGPPEGLPKYCSFARPVGPVWTSISFSSKPEIEEDEIVSTTGAGDTLVGGLVAGLVSGKREATFVQEATQAAGRTMRSIRAVG